MNISKIIEKQNKFKDKHGRHFQVIKGLKKNPNEQENFTFTFMDESIEIHEHRCPNTDSGFTIIECEDNNVKLTGQGCGSRTTNWAELGVGY